MKQQRILIAPLDWGLGHATRCIPLIHELSKKGALVIIAATGPIKNLLKEEFPEHLFVSLPAYNIKYARHSSMFFWRLLIQIPKVIKTIIAEHIALKKITRDYSIDIIISDNRFGLFHAYLPTVYITHQLNFKSGNAFFNEVAAGIHHWFIKKYKRCWIPDFEKNSLAGVLSHPSQKFKNLQYIGCLSRFDKIKNAEKLFDLLVLISGPEPRRTVFEKLILNQLIDYNGSVLFIRGLPGEELQLKNKPNKQNIIFKNHVSAPEISVLIQQSGLVICRSGYTTVMDLVKIQQKAILIPTPGQPEQEYLASYLFQKRIFYSVEEKNFRLTEAVSNALNFVNSFPDVDMKQYVNVIDDFLAEECL